MKKILKEGSYKSEYSDCFTANILLFSVESKDLMLDYEPTALDAINIKEALMKIMENRQRVRVKIHAITEDIERFKGGKF